MSHFGGHPFMRSGNWYDWPTPGLIFDQNFGGGFYDDDPLYRELADRSTNYLTAREQQRPTSTVLYWMRPAAVPRSTNTNRAHGSGTSEVACDKDKFQVNLDVKHFKPEELNVKTVDNMLTVEGKHEDRMDEHGYISRQFTRKYMLPKGVDPSQITSSLSPEGVLSLKAPIKALEAPHETVIPVQVGKAPEALKDNPEKQNVDDK